jgi:hypothetical protein
MRSATDDRRTRDGRGRQVGGMRAALTAAVVLVAALLAAAPSASALSQPSVTTSSAHQVSFASAVLYGSVNPNGADTSYYFQYGPTRAYGSQSTIGDAGSGTSRVNVRVPVTGLQPLTRYHYRIVGVNSAGLTTGGDSTFTTTKVPLALQILASPNPVPFGGSVTIQGTLSGTGNAGRVVQLQGNQFPFTAGFQNLANPELTTATGSFSFTLFGMSLVTQFRVVTTTNPLVISATTTEGVTVRVSTHVRRTASGRVRFYGSVIPASDGMRVGILHIVHGHGHLVAGTVLRHHSTHSSRYSRTLRVRHGVYRVLVVITGGALNSAYGRPVLIR